MKKRKLVVSYVRFITYLLLHRNFVNIVYDNVQKYLNDMNDIYKNIEEYNPNKKCKNISLVLSHSFCLFCKIFFCCTKKY